VATISTDEAEHLARLDRERDAVERDPVTEAPGQVL